MQNSFSSLSESFTTTREGRLMHSKFASVHLACVVATDRLYCLTDVFTAGSVVVLP